MIVWAGPSDDFDRIRYPFNAPQEGADFLDGWVGQDMDDSNGFYTIQLLRRQSDGRRYVRLYRWLSKDPTKKHRIQPADISDEVIADAAEHVGFAEHILERQENGCYQLFEGTNQPAE